MNHIKAFCNSPSCTRDKIGYDNSNIMVEKHVSRSKVECPNCGYALIWRNSNIIISKDKSIYRNITNNSLLNY